MKVRRCRRDPLSYIVFNRRVPGKFADSCSIVLSSRGHERRLEVEEAAKKARNVYTAFKKLYLWYVIGTR